MRRNAMIVAGCLLLLAASRPTLAHHAFSSEFDGNAPVELQGAVTRVQWINPHAWIHIDVKKSDGTVENWAIEGGTPNTLSRRGITRDTMKVGAVIKVTGYQAKDGSLKANGRNITYQDGRTVFMGSAGIGAPKDGQDPNDR